MSLKWGQADLVRASGVSDTTIRDIQQGLKVTYRPSTLAKIATALGWTEDSLDRIWRGEEPVNLGSTVVVGEDKQPALLSGKLERLSERDRRIIERMVDEMLGEE